MEKLFRWTCVFMSVVIVFSSFFMVIAVAKADGATFDILGTNDLVQNIENLEINMTSVIYVKNDKGEWEEYQRIHGEENRIWVELETIPKKLIDAFVAIEDQRFYTHNGVDWKRTLSAFINYLPFVKLYSSNQGGSTMTQQLIKNLTAEKETSAKRKIREIARALTIERKLEKDVILEAYLNTISLGNGICGVGVAANYYFNKDVSELNLSECAALAAITKNPSAYSPDSDPEENKERRQTVLNKMYELEMISEEEYDNFFDADIIIDKTQQTDYEVPVNSYFVDTLIDNVINDISERYGYSTDTASSMLYNGGLKIYATLDPDIQSAAEEVYLNQKKYFAQRARKDKTKHLQSAMTIMDYQGHILGVVGGVGEKTVNRGLNRAIDSPRQPGSTMKPLGVYAPAIDKGFATSTSVIVDEPLEKYYADGKKGPKEWYGYYAGPMTISKALERSANTIPCHILKEMGIETSYNFLTQSLNFKHLTDVDKNLASLALGGCQYGITTTESASAYAIFGNGGKYYKPVTYYKVEKATGEIVLTADMDGNQVISPATASIMNTLLQNVVYGSQGTGTSIRSYSKMKVYAKTGTSSESNDLWMVAGTPYYVASVWCGFDRQEKINNAGAAAAVWKAVMSKVHKGLEVKEFEEYTDFIEAKYCKYTGLLKGKKCYSTATGYYVPGIEVKTCDGKHTVMPNTGKNPEEETSSTESTTTSEGISSTPTTSAPPTDSSSDTTTSEETPPDDVVPPEGEEPTTPPEGEEPDDGGEGGGEGTEPPTPTTPPTDGDGDGNEPQTPTQ